MLYDCGSMSSKDALKECQRLLKHPKGCPEEARERLRALEKRILGS